MNLELLKAPFPENQIEWRVGRSGKNGAGRVWASCLAYVQARAIMDRLDSVCGMGRWRVEYTFIPTSQGIESGVIAKISILIDEGFWVTKEDGAEQTDIESFKGGISSALKRAGSVWGIGRYLYGLEEGFAEIVEKGTKDARYAKTKDGHEFYWLPPSLPQWALPPGARPKDPLPNVRPQPPEHGDGIQENFTNYRIPFGQYAKRSLEEVGPDKLKSYVLYLEGQSAKTGKPLVGVVADFIERASEYIGALESVPL